jgi:hypothetical protein
MPPPTSSPPITIAHPRPVPSSGRLAMVSTPRNDEQRDEDHRQVADGPVDDQSRPPPIVRIMPTASSAHQPLPTDRIDGAPTSAGRVGW